MRRPDQIVCLSITELKGVFQDLEKVERFLMIPDLFLHLKLSYTKVDTAFCIEKQQVRFTHLDKINVKIF